MKVFRSISKIAVDKPSAVTIGTFDGLHRGHQFVLNQLRAAAAERDLLTSVVTFDPHPRKVIAGPDAPPLSLLSTTAEKLEIFQHIGIDQVAVIPFTKEFANMGSEDFVRDILVSRLGAQLIMIGYDHHFGRNREGGIEHLQKLAENEPFEVAQLPAIDSQEKVISSSAIRALIEAGKVDEVREFLGRPYRVSGEVTRGDGRGRQIGFPTANIKVDDSDKCVPAKGVYAVDVLLGERQYKGMMNIGVRPTFDFDYLTLEVHIFNFDAVIYGQSVNILFKKFVRAEQKFSGIEQLKEQLHKDKSLCENI